MFDIFWKDDAHIGEGGIYYRDEIGVFIKSLMDKGYKVVGIKIDYDDIRNIEILVDDTDVGERTEDVK